MSNLEISMCKSMKFSFVLAHGGNLLDLRGFAWGIALLLPLPESAGERTHWLLSPSGGSHEVQKHSQNLNKHVMGAVF